MATVRGYRGDHRVGPPSGNPIPAFPLSSYVVNDLHVSLREAFRGLTNVIPCAYAWRRFACTGLRIANNVLILVVLVNRWIANNVLILVVFVNRRESNNILISLVFRRPGKAKPPPGKAAHILAKPGFAPIVKAPAGAFLPLVSTGFQRCNAGLRGTQDH